MDLKPKLNRIREICNEYNVAMLGVFGSFSIMKSIYFPTYMTIFKTVSIRLAIGILAFVIGLNFTWFVFLVSGEKRKCETFCLLHKAESLFESERNGTIEVTFKEFKYVNEKLVVEIEVFNNSSESAYFATYDGYKNASDLFRFNKKGDTEISSCGFGLFTSHIHSGDRVILHYSPYRFIETASKPGNYQIGYSYRLTNSEDSEIFWSNEFQLPDYVKSEIQKNKVY